MEKEQVIKLIRTIVAVGSERRDPHGAAGSGTVPISEPVMRAFIAVADYAEDPFRPICIQTLTEICEHNRWLIKNCFRMFPLTINGDMVV